MLRRFLDSPWLFFILAGLLLAATVLSQVEVRRPGRPVGTLADLPALAEREDLNLLFILIDTLRADRLSVYGYERPTTPYIDSLARGGILFRRCVSQSSWTKASMASMWTAQQPTTHGVVRYHHGLPASVRMPAEILQEAGFRTAGLYRNGWVDPNFGFGQGFDTYVKPLPGPAAARFERKRPVGRPLDGTDDEITGGALEFIRGYGDEPFFLYLHLMDVHQYAYDEESALFGTRYTDAYDNALHWVDRNVGAVLEGLQQAGLADRTIVVVASDHGEEFLEHGQEGHGRTLYREVVHVPLILSLPFRLEAPVVVESIAQNVDLWPTLLDLLGLPPLERADGRSLVPRIEAAARGEEDPGADGGVAYGYMDRNWGSVKRPPLPLVMVTRGGHRLILARRPGARGLAMLYDHGSDPTEQRNVARQQPEVTRELMALSQELLDRSASGPDAAPDEVEIDRLRRGQLEALGYVLE